METSDLDRLRRWENAGGTWQLAGRTATSVTIALCRCDGGEEVERLVSGERELLAYLDAQAGAGEGAGKDVGSLES
jgi:hypothetical protein